MDISRLSFLVLLCCICGIQDQSILSECQVTTNTVDWTVSGSCRVQEAFFSDGIFTCTWTRNDGETFGGFDNIHELCSFTQALPQAGGLYTYSISVSPPATTTFSQELKQVEPGDITTTCPHSVVSGRDLSCTCQTTNTASPPATVRWEGRDSEKLVKTNVQREDNGTQFTCHVTWAGRVYPSINYTLLVELEPGEVTTSCPHSVVRGRDLSCTCQTTNTSNPPATVRWEGRDSEKLVKTNVQREDNGTQFTCHVTWKGRVYTSINYTLLVKSVEGPSSVVINADSYRGTNGSGVLMLTCKAQVPLYPGANLTWIGVVCQNETHTDRTSTCTIIFGAEDDGKSVTCTAINSIESRIAASATVMLQINGTGFVVIVLPPSSPTSPLGTIIGAVVAVLCIAAIAFSIVVFIRPQRRKKAPEETAQSGAEIYENFSFNDTTNIDTTQQPPSVKEAQDQPNVYENTQIQRDHIYDTTCTTYEQHKYADLTVKATRDVKVTEYEVPERKEGVVYSNA